MLQSIIDLIKTYVELFSKLLSNIRMKQHVVISGGSKGIGKALAVKYAKLGYHVTIIARNQKDLEEAKREIEDRRKDSAQQIRTVTLDLIKLTFPTLSKGETMTNEQKKILNDILGEHEQCDILINCCGSSIPARFEDLTKEEFQFMMNVNYFSAVNLTRLLLPVMKSQQAKLVRDRARSKKSPGHIVFVSSMCGLMSFHGYSAYSASKFALVGLAEALHMELQPSNICVTVSFPPDTQTPGYDKENELKPELTAEISKSGSVYSPEEVADSIIRDVKAKRFYSTVGLENWLAVTALNAFMPTSFLRACLESFVAQPLRLIAFFIVDSWYRLALAEPYN